MIYLRILFILFFLVPLRLALIAYDCSTWSSNITTVSTVAVPPCTTPQDPNLESSEVIQLIQLADRYPVTVQQCKVEITRLINYCGMHSHNSIVTYGMMSYILETNEEQCKLLQSSGIYRVTNRVVLREIPRQSSTVRHVQLAGQTQDNGNCKGEYYSDQFGSWDNVVVTGYVKITLKSYEAVVVPDDDKIVLQNGLTCKANTKMCRDPESGDTFWSYQSSETCNPKLHLVLYEGPATRMVSHVGGSMIITYMVDNESKIFALRVNGFYQSCHFKMHQTEHPKLVIASKSDSGFIFSKQHIPVSSLDLMTYLNSKFVYVEKRITSTFTMLYKEVEAQRCNIQRRGLLTLLSLATIDPMEFAYSYMESAGYAGQILGEVVHILKCLPVEVSTKARITGCQKEWPVLYNNKTMYMSAKSHILQRYSTQYECDPRIKSMFLIDGDWYSHDGRVRREPSPQVLTADPIQGWKYESMRGLATAGIYDSEDIKRLENRLLNPYEHKAVANVLVRGFEGAAIDRQGMTMVNLLDPDTVETMAKSIMEKAWGWLSVFGNVTSGMIGLFMIFRLGKFVIDTAIHGRAIYELYGFSVALLGSIWDSLTTYLLHRGQTKETKAQRHELNIELGPIFSGARPTEPVNVRPSNSEVGYLIPNAPIYPNVPFAQP